MGSLHVEWIKTQPGVDGQEREADVVHTVKSES